METTANRLGLGRRARGCALLVRFRVLGSDVPATRSPSLHKYGHCAQHEARIDECRRAAAV